MNDRQKKRNAFMLCVLHRALNAALEDFKRRMCLGASFVNFNHSLNVLGPSA